MKIFCPECGALVTAEDINLQNGFAKCRQCQAVFSYAAAAKQEEQRHRQPPGGLPAGSPGGLLPRPARMEVANWAGTWSISWRWFSPVAIFLTVFCVIWDSILVVWYAMTLSHRGTPTIFALFPLIHVTIGLALTYFVVCCYVNRTRILIDSQALVVKHGPLPWFGGGRYNRTDIRQLFCEQSRVTSSNDTSTTYYYNLMALLADGTKHKLVATLSDVSEAKFLEQQLERQMGIVDQPVVGEV